MNLDVETAVKRLTIKDAILKHFSIHQAQIQWGGGRCPPWSVEGGGHFLAKYLQKRLIFIYTKNCSGPHRSFSDGGGQKIVHASCVNSHTQSFAPPCKILYPRLLPINVNINYMSVQCGAIRSEQF